MRILLVIPVKPPATAKSRLAPRLNAVQREDLAWALMHDTLALARHVKKRAPDVTVCVVSSDRRVVDNAESCGAACVREPESRGMAEAVKYVQNTNNDMTPADALIVLPTDVPFATADDLMEVIDIVRATHEGAVLVPSRRADGTNILGLVPGRALAPCFGPDSFTVFMEACRDIDMPCRIIDNPRLGCDLDTPEDFDDLVARCDNAGPHVQAFLERLNAQTPRAVSP